MPSWVRRAILAGSAAGVAVVIGACATDPGNHRALPGQTAVGLAAIAGSAPAVTPDPTAATAATAIRVTVPELTVAGTIANLTAPVTVPSTTPAAPPPAANAEPPATPAPAAEPAPAEPAPEPVPPPAPSPVTVVAPYTTVLGWTGEGKVAYLTFDDGPGPDTGRILDVLAGRGVAATFCVLGQRVSENVETTRRIVAEGHTLCNHSWDHPTAFDTLAPDVLAGQIGRTQEAVVQATGHTPRYLRAPEGRFGEPAGTVHQAAQQARTLLLGWAVDSRDWTTPGAAAILANVTGAVGPGAVILLHDAGGADRQQTVDALPGIIDGLRAAGYTLLPLPPDPSG
jgi:peptidoglycan/xylan/chitin deacetylase (PgdA/CDA1 family)